MGSQENTQNDFIDIRSFVSKIIRHWIVFIISFGLFMFLAILFLRYSSPKYKITSSVLIRDEINHSVGAENLIESLEIYSGRKNIENEVGILTSYQLIYKAVQDLSFEVSYHTRGLIGSVERYGDFPIKVSVTPGVPQIIETEFSIRPISDSAFILEVNADDFIPQSTGQSSLRNKVVDSYRFKKEYKFDKLIQTDFFSFVISKNTVDRDDQERFSDICFVVHNLNSIAKEYKEKNLVAEPVSIQSSILQLSCTGHIVEKEADFLNKISELYVQRGLEEKNAIATNAIQFIDKQIHHISDSLSGSEDKLETFRTADKIMDLDFYAKKSYEQLEELERKNAELSVKYKYYKYLQEYVNTSNELNKMVAPSAIGIDDPLLNNLIQEISKLASEKASLSFTLKENNPTIHMLNLKIKDVKNNLEENIKNIISSSEISIAENNKRIHALSGSVSKLPGHEKALAIIQRKFRHNDEMYNYLMEKRAEAEIAKASNTPDHKILDKARMFGDSPRSPKKLLIIFGAAFIMSLVFALGYIVTKDLVYNKVESKEQLQRLLQAPYIHTLHHNSKESQLPVKYLQGAAISESIRSLRVYFQVNYDKGKKVIAITSFQQGEGKTFLALNFATSLAMSGSKVALLDLNVRDPKLLWYFDLQNTHNESSDNLWQYHDKVLKTNIDNLNIVAIDLTAPGLLENINTPGLDSLLGFLKSTYDYIVVDTAAIGPFSDYHLISRQMDFQILLSRNHVTDIQSIKEVLALIKSGLMRPDLFVLNDVVN